MLDVRSLTVSIQTRAGRVTVVDDVSFAIAPGQTLALVGESGSGKSVTALGLLRLLDPGLRPRLAGEVRFEGQDLLRLSDAALRRLRGARIAMVFQDPLSALNPVQRVGQQVAEAVRLHQPVTRAQAWARAVSLLDRVGIREPARRARDYPHQLSGGMRQRVVIAMALAGRPRLLIADEPTTALDVQTQAQILALLRQLQAEEGLGLLLISHDLGVVADMADRVAVMYAGKLVEYGDAAVFFKTARHPYSDGLLQTVWPLQTGTAEPYSLLPEIAGTVPALADLPAGCAFAPRCPQATAACTRQRPAWLAMGADGQGVACLHPLHAAQPAPARVAIEEPA
jgi:oligopeptide/dipeptide ABC transporter ATP-binding protein